jgi:hypothetical protein
VRSNMQYNRAKLVEQMFDYYIGIGEWDIIVKFALMDDKELLTFYLEHYGNFN